VFAHINHSPLLNSAIALSRNTPPAANEGYNGALGVARGCNILEQTTLSTDAIASVINVVE